MHVPKARDWYVEIDTHLNPYIPRNRVNRLPRPISHFLGHRDKPRTQIGNILVAGWALLGAFVGVVVVEAVFMAPMIKGHGVPLLITSFVSSVQHSLLVECSPIPTGCRSDFRIQYD